MGYANRDAYGPNGGLSRLHTPRYINVEGEVDRAPPENQMVLARSGLWGSGIEHWLALIEGWRAEGNIKGIEVCS